MVEIRPVKCSEIEQADNADWLLREYAIDCSMGDYDPQWAMYESLENIGTLHCFGAYLSAELIGFVSIVNTVMPHNGKRMASIESLFVMAQHRYSGAGNLLLEEARTFAKALGCVKLLYTARRGSALETVLSRRAGCKATHTGFTEDL